MYKAELSLPDELVIRLASVIAAKIGYNWHDHDHDTPRTFLKRVAAAYRQQV